VDRTNVEEALSAIVREANSRTTPVDYVSRLYQVEMEVLSRINKIMEETREKERQNTGNENII
jgi:hypothetical protein